MRPSGKSHSDKSHSDPAPAERTLLSHDPSHIDACAPAAVGASGAAAALGLAIAAPAADGLVELRHGEATRPLLRARRLFHPVPRASRRRGRSRYLFVLGGAVALGLRFRRPLQACVAKVRSLPDSLAAISARIGAPAEAREGRPSPSGPLAVRADGSRVASVGARGPQPARRRGRRRRGGVPASEGRPERRGADAAHRAPLAARQRRRRVEPDARQERRARLGRRGGRVGGGVGGGGAAGGAGGECEPRQPARGQPAHGQPARGPQHAGGPGEHRVAHRGARCPPGGRRHPLLLTRPRPCSAARRGGGAGAGARGRAAAGRAARRRGWRRRCLCCCCCRCCRCHRR